MTEQEEAPPVGEQVHLPGPSYLPFWNAFGIMLLVVGTTLGTIFLVAGATIFLYTTIRWIRETRRDIAALPEDHGG